MFFDGSMRSSFGVERLGAERAARLRAAHGERGEHHAPRKAAMATSVFAPHGRAAGRRRPRR
jgi:hypothetical protein